MIITNTSLFDTDNTVSDKTGLSTIESIFVQTKANCSSSYTEEFYLYNTYTLDATLVKNEVTLECEIDATLVIDLGDLSFVSGAIVINGGSTTLTSEVIDFVSPGGATNIVTMIVEDSEGVTYTASYTFTTSSDPCTDDYFYTSSIANVSSFTMNFVTVTSDRETDYYVLKDGVITFKPEAFGLESSNTNDTSDGFYSMTITWTDTNSLFTTEEKCVFVFCCIYNDVLNFINKNPEKSCEAFGIFHSLMLVNELCVECSLACETYQYLMNLIDCDGCY